MDEWYHNRSYAPQIMPNKKDKSNMLKKVGKREQWKRKRKKKWEDPVATVALDVIKHIPHQSYT